jgi:acyl-CoA synthetase (AMP-forming)/AMP-acid ligase II
MIDLHGVALLDDMLPLWAGRQPNAVALWCDGRETSYAELDARATQVANGLIAMGLPPQSRIGFLGKNSDRYFELFFGAAKANMVVVAINWRLAPPEISYILKDSDCEIIFIGADYMDVMTEIAPDLPRLSHFIAMDGGHAKWSAFDDWRMRQSTAKPAQTATPDSDVIQLYTSGTTGNPKGVQLTHGNYFDLFNQANHAGWAKLEPNATQLVAMPLFHVAGVNMGIIGLAQGARSIILREVDIPTILRLIPEHRVEAAFLVPAVIMFMVQAAEKMPVDFSSLKLIYYGASPIAEELLLQAKALFKCEFAQLYGLTETLGGATCLGPEDHDPARGKLRSCGKPHVGVDIRIVDEEGRDVPNGAVGEIVYKSKSLMKGYWNNPEATAKSIRQGWFHTGDAGFFDDDGFLYIHDRVKDMIVSGGENIYPAEVENALFAHPAIADVAVIGVPDDKWGEAVKAIIVLKPNTDLEIDTLREWARSRIASYKLPKSLDIVPSLPRNPTGKILRRTLREPYWADRERRVN